METIYEQLGITQNHYSFITPVQRIYPNFFFDQVLFTVDFENFDCHSQSDIEEFCKEFDIIWIETIKTTSKGISTTVSYCMQNTNQFIDNWLENIEDSI